MTILITVKGETSFCKPSNTSVSRATIPTKSAIIGLVAAALGLDARSSNYQARLKELYDQINFAVLVIKPGIVTRDFQIAQNTTKANGKVNSSNIIMENEVIYDTHCIIAIESKQELEIAKGLLRPKYALYLGKRYSSVNSDFYKFTVVDESPNEALERLNISGVIYSDNKSDKANIIKTSERITSIDRSFASRTVFVKKTKDQSNESVLR